MNSYKKPKISRIGDVEDITESGGTNDNAQCFSRAGKSDDYNPNC